MNSEIHGNNNNNARTDSDAPQVGKHSFFNGIRCAPVGKYENIKAGIRHLINKKIAISKRGSSVPQEKNNENDPAAQSRSVSPSPKFPNKRSNSVSSNLAYIDDDDRKLEDFSEPRAVSAPPKFSNENNPAAQSRSVSPSPKFPNERSDSVSSNLAYIDDDDRKLEDFSEPRAVSAPPKFSNENDPAAQNRSVLPSPKSSN
ncbi:MAG: hypothetical protein LBI61_00240 [Puniceicoccales bacterium]|jgi:hypothetical protein|nr:hypothetical protein [Puniceicoccales bacterium]